MKTAAEIVEALARERRVETLVKNVCKTSGPDMGDLAQIVYLALLQTPAPLLNDLVENGQMDFYAVRIIKNQYYGRKSRFHLDTRAFRDRTVELKPNDYEKTDSAK